MKARWAVAAASAGALALGLMAPAATSAAPSRPDGEAYMRVTAPIASAAERDRGGYRVIVPADAEITWLGEVNGRSTSGTYTGSQLAANWKRMGYRNGVRAFTTVSWLPKGAERHARLVVRLTNPRIDDAGRLVFIAKTRGYTLPRTLKDFSLDIAQSSALRQSRWTVAFDPFNIDTAGTGQVQVTSVVNDTTATVEWPQPGNSTNPTCRGVVNIGPPKGEVVISGFACGTGQVNGTDTYGDSSDLVLYPATKDKNGIGSVYACFGYTPQQGAKINWCNTIAEWNKSGQSTL